MMMMMMRRQKERATKVDTTTKTHPSRGAPEIGLVQRAASTVDHAKRGDARDHDDDFPTTTT